MYEPSAWQHCESSIEFEKFGVGERVGMLEAYVTGWTTEECDCCLRSWTEGTDVFGEGD